MSNNGIPEVDNTIEELWAEAATQIANIDSGESTRDCCQVRRQQWQEGVMKVMNAPNR